MSGFWRAWLRIWCIGTIGLGAAFAAAAWPGADGPARFYYDAVFWPIDGASVLDPQELRFTIGVLGAVMIGWGVSVYGVIGTVFARSADGGDGAVWRALTLGLAAWFVVDGAISLFLGPFNVVANIVFLVAWLIPMLATGALRGR